MFKKMNVFSIILALFFLASPQVFAARIQPSPDSIPFAPPVNYPVGHHPHCVCGADFDGDGDIDLAVANEGSNTVTILRNLGDGTFRTDTDYVVGNAPFSIFVADFDTDGHCDLVVTNYGDSTISVLMNQGDGTFGPPVVYQVGYQPWCVSSADLDRDGDSDLVVACESNRIYILENNGDGTFQLLQEIIQWCPYSISLADLDNDGDCDMAAVQSGCSGGPDLFIYMNYGNGTFAPPVPYYYHPSNSYPSVFAADFDMDGDNDLALAVWYGGKIAIFENNGNGTFQSPVDYQASGSYTSCVFGKDFDQDGDCDLATANFGPYLWGNVNIFRNNGDGTFQPPIAYEAGSNPISVFSVDLDGDLDNDLVTANYSSDNVPVLLNRTVTDISDNIWVHLSGSPEIGPGDTLRYILSFGNVSNAEATQCTLFTNFGDLELVWASLPYIPVGDTAAIWNIGNIQPGEFGQIMVGLTLPESPFSQYLRESVTCPQLVEIVVATIVGMVVSYAVSKTIEYDIDVFSSHPDIVLTKHQWTAFSPPEASIELECSNNGTGVACVKPTISATVTCDLPECLLDVSAPGGTVDTAGGRWNITLPIPEDIVPFWDFHPGITAYGCFVHFSLATNPNCAHKNVYVSARASYFNDEDEPARFKWDNRILNQPHEILFAWDPNEMVVYPENFIKPGHTLNYAVFFENEGSAPAESIRVISKIDTALADETVFITDTSAVYNAFHRRIDWNFPHINLQPDSSSFVSYSIQVKDSLESGTVIRGDAMIYFDYMPAVPCSVSITVDALNPISQVDSVIRVAFPDTYQVFWSGYDLMPGSSGIISYSIYFSMDGGTDSLWLADTSWFEEDTLQTSATFVGEPGHYYCFSSIAMDRVWNIEEPSGAPDACIPFLHGDANADWKIEVSDVVFLINYLFKSGQTPNPLGRGDANCDSVVDVGDVVYLINYLFKNGPPPPC